MYKITFSNDISVLFIAMIDLYLSRNTYNCECEGTGMSKHDIIDFEVGMHEIMVVKMFDARFDIFKTSIADQNEHGCYVLW